MKNRFIKLFKEKLTPDRVNKFTLIYVTLFFALVYLIPFLIYLFLSYLMEIFEINNGFWGVVLVLFVQLFNIFTFYPLIFILAKKYQQKNCFNKKFFKVIFLFLSAMCFFLVTRDLFFGSVSILILYFSISDPRLFNYKSKNLTPIYRFLIRFLIISFFVSLIGNLFYEIFSALNDIYQNQILLFVALGSRFAFPFFVILLMSFFYIFKNDFNLHLLIDKQKFTIYTLAIFVSGLLLLPFILLTSLKNGDSLLLNTLESSILWILCDLFFIYLISLAYSLIIYSLKLDPNKNPIKFVIFTLIIIFLLPIITAVYWDFILIIVYTLLNAIDWKFESTFISIIILGLARIIIPASLLYYYAKFKKLKLFWYKLFVYAIIIFSIIAALDSFISKYFF